MLPSGNSGPALRKIPPSPLSEKGLEINAAAGGIGSLTQEARIFMKGFLWRWPKVAPAKSRFVILSIVKDLIIR
jgi:hypothetical protein